MTDLIILSGAPARHSQLSFVKLGGLHVGRAFAEILQAFGHALDLACVQPYLFDGDRSSRPKAVLEGSEKGRDPSW